MMAQRRYTDRQVENAVATAVLIGHIDKAVKSLRIPEATLRSWLRARGYRTVHGEIYLKSSGPPADTGTSSTTTN